MKHALVLFAVVCLLAAAPAPAQETPQTLVSTYDDLADAILALNAAEEDVVRSILL